MLSSLSNANATAGQLVKDLHSPNARIYWTDLLLTAGAGWVAFVFAAALLRTPWLALPAIAVSALGLYRGLCFLHEITHLRSSLLRRFELVWNILFGVPLLLPSFMYVGVHQNHHSLSTYGTECDPEYLPFWGRPLMIVLFVLQAALIPALLVFRFFVLAPASLVSQAVRRWTAAHASALTMNLKYVRDVSPAVAGAIQRWEIVSMLSWLAIGIAAMSFHVAARLFITWYVVSATVAVMNSVRTLGAHRYASDGAALDREAQLGDSIDTPGAFWTELWAPVGLRYHALHHYFPGIPYHNLPAAYRRLTATLPTDAPYHRATSPGLPHSLGTLYRGK
jgi:fatty acid desaturase